MVSKSFTTSVNFTTSVSSMAAAKSCNMSTDAHTQDLAHRDQSITMSYPANTGVQNEAEG
jgi:hypothetical protein